MSAAQRLQSLQGDEKMAQRAFHFSYHSICWELRAWWSSGLIKKELLLNKTCQPILGSRLNNTEQISRADTICVPAFCSWWESILLVCWDKLPDHKPLLHLVPLALQKHTWAFRRVYLGGSKGAVAQTPHGILLSKYQLTARGEVTC